MRLEQTRSNGNVAALITVYHSLGQRFESSPADCRRQRRRIHFARHFLPADTL